MAFELCGMSLKDVIDTRALHPLPRRQLREIALQLIRGLERALLNDFSEVDLSPVSNRSTFFPYSAHRHQA